MTLRRTGIKRGTKGLERSGRLQSKGLPGRGKALKPVRPKRTEEEKYGRDKVDERAGLLDGYVRCEIQILSVCIGHGTDWHHRRNRTQGGTWAPSNGLKACRFCHAAVTDSRQEYGTKGWWVKEWEDWTTKPVLRCGQWVLLDDHGSFTPSLPFEEAS